MSRAVKQVDFGFIVALKLTSSLYNTPEFKCIVFNFCFYWSKKVQNFKTKKFDKANKFALARYTSGEMV